ncbi:MAG: DNA polymerase [Candidatus Pacebacteria bacterium]|nr:DNA polymerase [Candidatus Paceibacterota bacterium]
MEMQRPIIYLDIETDNTNGRGLDCFRSKVVTVQLMLPSGKVVIIKDPENLDEVKELLEYSLVIGHNIKFDATWLKHHFGITLYSVYDTMIAEVVISGGLYAGKRGVTGLKDVVARRCGVEMDKYEQTGFVWGTPLTEAQKKYAADDLKYLPEIYRQQQEEIKKLDLEEVIDIEMRAIPAMVWLYLSGISFDAKKLGELKRSLLIRKSEAQDKLYKAFGTSKLNFSSPYQIKKALASIGIIVEDASVDSIMDMKVKAVKGTLKQEKTGKQAVLFDVGEELSPVEILEAITEYKESEKLLNTFVGKLPTYVHPKTGRVHANYMQLGAKSGRMSCSMPNMQQQPSKRLPEWRSIFTAPPGKKMVVADYSQAELRILTELSKDEFFIRAYQNGEDLHKLTASKIYHKELDDVTKTERQICKSVNFGLSYGMSATGLQRRLKTDSGIEISEDEAKSTVKGFFTAYPGVANYLNNIAQEGLINLQVRTKAGRLMLFDAPKDESEEGSIQRLSKNLPIQGLCADFVKVALGNVFLKLEGKGVLLCAIVHDEIVLESPEEIAEEVKAILEEEMGKAITRYITCIPAYAEGVISDHWEH